MAQGGEPPADPPPVSQEEQAASTVINLLRPPFKVGVEGDTAVARLAAIRERMRTGGSVLERENALGALSFLAKKPRFVTTSNLRSCHKAFLQRATPSTTYLTTWHRPPGARHTSSLPTAPLSAPHQRSSDTQRHRKFIQTIT